MCSSKVVSVLKNSIFWDITPCSPLKVSQHFMLVSCVAYCSTLKMEGTCSSKTLVDFQQTTKLVEFYLLGYNFMVSSKSQLMFLRNMFPPFLGADESAKQETSIKQAASTQL
jgi:hypothetical protein